ncbi:type IV pilin protein [Inhella inkyongensis]|uniref:type IV pilin protein n=1 Tax=Inhella inkyongensis TaxID=392593 RepID=UPI00217546E1|nr:type IV pilin protein [Inhella inkyongensis]
MLAPPSRGFSLIELMIAVAIVAILAAIALPAYSSYLQRSRRAEVQSFMQDVIARQQHYLVDRRAYSDSITNAPAAGGLGMTVPSSVAAVYTLTMTTDNTVKPMTVSLSAAPKSGTAQASDSCGTLVITQAGDKSADKAGCW